MKMRQTLSVLLVVSVWNQICDALHNDVFRSGENQEQPCIRTLTEVGNIQNFIGQFKSYTKRRTDTEDSPQSLAQLLLADMDLSVHPCDNFYTFVCGGYMNRSAPAGGFIPLFDSRRNVIMDIIKTKISEPIKQNDDSPLRQAKQLYYSCMDESSIEKRELLPLQQFLTDHGGWPVLGHWNSDGFDMVNLITKTSLLIEHYEFHYQPAGVIIGSVIQRDFKRKGKFAFYLDQANLGQFRIGNFINHEVYRLGTENFYNKAYEDYLVDIAVLLGADVQTARHDMRDVLILETKLAEVMLLEEERRLVKDRYNPMSILELSLRYPYLDWLRYFRQTLSTLNVMVDGHTEVVLWAPSYYDKLGKILAETSKRTLANYILFRALQPLIPAANKAIRYVSLRYIATVNGIRDPSLPARDDFCTSIVNDQMSWVTSRIYLNNSSQKDRVVRVTEIKNFVRREFLEMIKSANWLSKTTKRLVFKKMKSFGIDIGFPSEINTNSFLNNYYKHFTIKNSFFENIKECSIENSKIVLSKLKYSPLTDWLLRPVIINAWHRIETGNIEISYGMMASPFYNATYPASMNFGGIGFFIGHEYGHGVEQTGLYFDVDGILGNYWSKKSFHNFLHKEKCFIDQFSRYYIPEADLFVTNGGKTINENICDHLGLRSSFYAYQKYKRQTATVDHVPGLPFTGDQLFFINSARMWCTSASPVFLRKFPLIDHHAMNRLRVIGPLQNSQEFANAFNCPVGTFMNPAKKCDFW